MFFKLTDLVVDALDRTTYFLNLGMQRLKDGNRLVDFLTLHRKCFRHFLRNRNTDLRIAQQFIDNRVNLFC